jgi:parallel beta-helix repeat protein/predicted outer membrane repeat protein
MRGVTYLIAIIVITIIGGVRGAVIHVPDEYSTIQAGIQAAVDGDTVLVADGTYKGEGNRDITFLGKAIVVTSEHGPEVTIVDCEGVPRERRRGFIFTDGEDSTSELKGFKIINGYVELYWPYDHGGAIYCAGSSPTIEGNVIDGNFANSAGGGIACFENSHPIIIGNTIVNNTTAREGGGIYLHSSSPIIQYNTIMDNTGKYSGSICSYRSSTLIEENTISGNSATYGYGGGIRCEEDSLSTIISNYVTGNYAGKHGGGIYCDGTSPLIEANIISGNTARYDGGGLNLQSCNSTVTGNTIRNNTANIGGGIFCGLVCCPVIDDNILTYNSAKTQGGSIGCVRDNSAIITSTVIAENSADQDVGVYCTDCCFPTIMRCTITGNVAYNLGVTNYGCGIGCYDHSIATVTNCILWKDSCASETVTKPEIYIDSTSAITVTYSDIEGGWEGTGNIDADPLFVLPKKQDYRLLWGSPCINAGLPDSNDPDSRSDIGAYHFDQTDTFTVYLTPDKRSITSGDTLGITYTLINRWPESASFWVRSNVYPPSGGSVVVLGPELHELASDTFIQFYVQHAVPKKAPSGQYEYTCRIGVPPQILFDHDSFSFKIRH